LKEKKSKVSKPSLKNQSGSEKSKRENQSFQIKWINFFLQNCISVKWDLQIYGKEMGRPGVPV
jgi:hypothetical protein